MEKVSIIIPVHNSSLYIKECLDSVISQTYKNLEIIIINDHSIDNSIEIINSYKDKRIKVYNLEEKGVAYARNKGIEKSTGNYIAFLDSDDYWKKDKINKQINYIKNKAFIYSGYAFFKNNKTHRVNVPKKITYKQALKNTTIFTSTVMFNMNLLRKEDIYMPLLEKGQDTATWWKVLKKVNYAYGINEVLAFYRVGNSSLSSNKLKALKRTWKIYKREELSFIKRLYYFNFYIFNAIRRRVF